MLGLLLLAIVTITLVATFNRYLWEGALPWAVEASMLMWAWMIQLSVLRAAHIRVDFFIDLAPPRLRPLLDLMIAIICLGTLYVLTDSALGMARFTADDFFIALPRVSRQWLYIPLLVVGPLWAVRIGLEAYERWRGSAA
ncbi:TRAP transporter small permease [Psychromarinibacter sp. C21-152]|uniref:TRAP transporter small permease protein n=2 Tax=Psychromarinibacter sediminicola TaxID=3033385 RepID=A0AAE3NNU0_9RHOB|nr:TRAP transporter small permease [Psychromarinibacter sediminicola]